MTSKTYKKYHINPETGTVGICVARYQCRFGGPGDHYPSEQDARSAFEREMDRDQYAFSIFAANPVSPLPAGIIVEENGESVARLPAGEYFIGDPYILVGTYDEQGWSDWVETVDADMGWENDIVDPSQEKTPIVGALYGGEPIVAAKAFHGSGLHWCPSPPRRVPADAGLISAIPMRVLDKMGISGEVARKKKLGFVHEFSEDFTLTREDNGNMHFGDVLIVVHNDTLPEEAWKVLDQGDNQDTVYEETEQAKAIRRKTYKRVVDEFLDIKV